MIERILVDTGPMVAVLSEDDRHHPLCAAALGGLTSPLLTCWPVITEAAWLLRTRPHSLQRLVRSFGHGFFVLVDLGIDDLFAIVELMDRYESLRLQIADDALIHLAERENIHTVFTTDRRDFSIIRLKRNRSLRLIPDIP